MGTLLKTGALDVQLETQSGSKLIIHPEDGRKIDVWTTNKSFKLYKDMDEFIEASAECQEVELVQPNDYDKKAIGISKSLQSDLGQPGSVILVRKMGNLFIKPS